ncbi:hypothetical protein [Aquimarina rhabdastrellae]
MVSSNVYFKQDDKKIYHIHCKTLDKKEVIDEALDVVMQVIKKAISEGESIIETTFYENDKEVDYDGVFWGKVANLKESRDKVEEYIAFILNIFETDEEHYWEGDEVQLADIAAYKFAMADKQYIPFYAKCLKCWDMGHEVFQSEHIEEIISKYGWIPEIEELIIARATCNGQHDAEQIEELEELILEHNEPLEDSEFYIRFVRAIEDKLMTGSGWENYAEYAFPTKRLLEAAQNIKEKI